MSQPKTLPVRDLTLDLENYRTVVQASEASAVKAMVSTSPDRFWALMDSLLDDGYLPTESILVLASPDGAGFFVKEGNRRVAAMKVILGLLDGTDLPMPTALRGRIAALDGDWESANSSVPCVVYEPSESATVDRIVTLAHGKGEKAGRDQWNAVARARHKRDAQGKSESALDLLEAYLKSGLNLTAAQAGRWAGEYPLTVLEEAMKKIAPRLDFRNSRALADAYPSMDARDALERILRDIGLTLLNFEGIRRGDPDFMVGYGIAAKPAEATEAEPAADGTGNGTTTASSGTTPSGTTPKLGKSTEPVSPSATSPAAVKALLKGFVPKGSGREKVVVLRDEARLLSISKTPLAFCFVLRSMFEISAKAYCADHAKSGGPSFSRPDGSDKNLATVLQDITKHLSNGQKDKAVLRALHGAITELGRKEGLLSVTSMNQLVHNPKFLIAPNDIYLMFGNVFPLLEAMNG
jgi:hypothetical protein